MDHSKRVSLKENVDAFKAWMATRWDELAAWAARKPVRRFLADKSVVGLLGAAGVVLSMSALTIVIGIGETQIAAVEAIPLHHPELILNWWFRIGLGLFSIGIVLSLLALSAYGSKAAALKEFPDLVIRVLLRADYDAREPAPPEGRGELVRLAHVRLLVRNEERERGVTLPVHMEFDVRPDAALPGAPFDATTLTSLGFWASTWTPSPVDVAGVPGIHPLELPLYVPAGTQKEGDVFFPIPESWVPRLSPHAQRGRVVVVDRKTDKSVSFEHGYPDDRVLQ